MPIHAILEPGTADRISAHNAMGQVSAATPCFPWENGMREAGWERGMVAGAESKTAPQAVPQLTSLFVHLARVHIGVHQTDHRLDDDVASNHLPTA
jgi:hypothetical protein